MLCRCATAGWLSLQLSQVENNKRAFRDWHPGMDFIPLFKPSVDSMLILLRLFQCQCDWPAAASFFGKMVLSILILARAHAMFG